MSILSKIFYLVDEMNHKGSNLLDYPNVTEINDIVYDESLPEICKLDVLFDEAQLPESGKYPVVFNVHGGGWISGDKHFRRGVSIQYANDGNLCVNINYALTPEYTYQLMMQNVFSALKWVKEHAEEYKMDLDKMVITGDSAGAHITAATCVILKNKDWQEKFEITPVDVDFKGAMLFCGPYDFSEFWMHFPVLDYMLKGIAGIKWQKDLKKAPFYDYLNPIPAVTAEFPKSLVVMGGLDFVCNPHQRKMMRKFDEVGVPYQKYKCHNVLNNFHDFHLKIWMPSAKKTMRVAMDFVKEVIA